MLRFRSSGENGVEKPDTPNIIRKDVTNVDGIDIVSSEIRRPDEILKLKLKNSQFSDSEWLLAVAHWGIEGSMALDFKEWMIKNPGDGYFGSIQKKFQTDIPRTDRSRWWAEFTRYILNILDSTDLDELGRFGVWVKENGIADKTLLRGIVKEFLDA